MDIMSPYHLRSSVEARRLMELPQLRALITFSDWARRSFALHFGPKVEQSVVQFIPSLLKDLIAEILKNVLTISLLYQLIFRTKCGPEVVRAFCNARKN